MAMTFEEAMELLSGMFATLPRPVLSLVLESHSGNMERTVDYLITLSPQVCVGAFARSRVPVRARARVCACVCRVSDSQSFPHANLMSPRGRAGA
jgi:hypothetical protein